MRESIITVKPHFDTSVIAARGNDTGDTWIPLRAINVLRVRVIHRTYETKGRLMLVGIDVFAEHTYNVVAAGRDDQARFLAPIHVVNGARMEARQRADTLPGGLVVGCFDAHLVTRFVLLPDF